MPVFLGQAVRAYVWRSAGKVGPLASRLLTSFQVIGTDTGRLGTYDFLLVVRSNCGSISYRFETNGAISIEIAIFSCPPPLTGLPVEFCTGGGAQKLE